MCACLYYRWSGSHIKWGQSFRIRHITTGRYLCLDEEKGLLLVDPEKANSKMSAFCFRISKVIVIQSQLCQKTLKKNCNVSEAPLCSKDILNSHFLFNLQEKIEVTQKRDVEGMGTPEIKYGESMCFVQHASTGLWLTYAAVDAKSARLGPLKRKVKPNYPARWSAVTNEY